MTLKRLLGTFFWVLALGIAPVALGQQDPADDEEQEQKKKKWPFAMYFETAVGQATADTVNTSIDTNTSGLLDSQNFLDLESQRYGRFAIGWKFPREKGDIRLRFTGYREDGYDFNATGRSGTIPVQGSPGAGVDVAENLDFWNVNVSDGLLSSQLTVPECVQANDPVTGLPICAQIVYDPNNPNNLSQRRQTADDLGNQVQVWDLVYGRVFGPPKYTARWWGGLRYFSYQGVLPAAAWLNTSGTGYTDGSSLRLLRLEQDTKAFGPTGAMEARFNFFDQRFTVFLGGQATFLFAQLELDSGPFFTLISDDTGANDLTVDARLRAERDKSIWHTAGEAGLRYKFRSGVGLELAYNISGYLDSLLVPTGIIIPTSTLSTRQCAADGCTSAIYNTKDWVIQSWRFGASFQF